MAAGLLQRDGRLYASGELLLSTVAGLWPQARESWRSGSCVEVDLSGVTHADSAGVALLVEWLREARAAGCEVRFVAMPEQMRAIAVVSDLDELLHCGA
ncbi:STAS domain-containing protein [Plasticicumulans acidivorans]|uniref:Phospholipid transport system transporter-binding protein n=1 Tax=Plasticicumulans acidivorans TaxID=886464 RepID=A0A317MUW8_9GAMM|nr:STAS domain-containing protein [Plasticicumulans acidivorans]PWV61806.1 phospholipid transport system transporter-binding protein [Plasticicumulans acidivorans]